MTRINPAHVNPPPEVTPEEAERNKRQQSEQEAALHDPKAEKGEVPPVHPDKATG